jgi:hypothetical protein
MTFGRICPRYLHLRYAGEVPGQAQGVNLAMLSVVEPNYCYPWYSGLIRLCALGEEGLGKVKTASLQCLM